MDSPKDSNSSGSHSPNEKKFPVRRPVNPPQSAKTDDDLSPSKRTRPDSDRPSSPRELPPLLFRCNTPPRDGPVNQPQSATTDDDLSPSKRTRPDSDRPSSPRELPPLLFRCNTPPRDDADDGKLSNLFTKLGSDVPRTPDVSPNKTSRLSPKSQASPKKRSPRSVTSLLHQLGLSPTKHPKKISPSPTRVVVAAATSSTQGFDVPRTPEVSPNKASRLSPRSQASPRKRSPRSVTSLLHQLGLSPTKPQECRQESSRVPTDLPVPPPAFKVAPELAKYPGIRALPSFKIPDKIDTEFAMALKKRTRSLDTALIIAEEESVIEIVLVKKDIGLNLIGGSDTLTKGPAAAILEVIEGYAAHEDSRLKCGDQIRECDGTLINESMTKAEINHCIKGTEKMTTRLTVFRPFRAFEGIIKTGLVRKPGEAFGFTVRDSRSDYGLYIDRVDPGGPLDRHEMFQEGDFVLQIRNVKITTAPLHKHTPSDVESILKNTDDLVIFLKVRRFRIFPREVGRGIPIKKPVERF